MTLDFDIDEKTTEAKLTFSYQNFKSERDFRLALTLITMVCGDYYLDPDLDLEHFQELIETIKKSQKDTITFFISEDGLEAQLA